MNAFEEAKGIEQRGMEVLLPYIAERSAHGYVLIDKSPLAKYLQCIAGDVMFNSRRGRLVSVEIKVEQRHTGNLFLETWSNRNLEGRQDHAERGSNPGWLYHSRADWLLYYFLDTDDLYSLDMFELKRWAFRADKGGRARIGAFPEHPQERRAQPNDTWGRLVQVDVLHKEAGLRHCKVRQIELSCTQTEGRRDRSFGPPPPGARAWAGSGAPLGPILDLI